MPPFQRSIHQSSTRAAPVGEWNWIAKTLPDHAEAGGGLMVAVILLLAGVLAFLTSRPRAMQRA